MGPRCGVLLARAASAHDRTDRRLDLYGTDVQHSAVARTGTFLMRAVVLGAGPAGLLFAYLAQKRNPHWRVEVFEQNPPDATFGFGVVFSEGGLAFLERDAPEFHDALLPRLESWPMQRIVHRDERVDIDGSGFSAIARLDLNMFLRKLAGMRAFASPTASRSPPSRNSDRQI